VGVVAREQGGGEERGVHGGRGARGGAAGKAEPGAERPWRDRLPRTSSG
jgi:hypothetical protein